MQKASEKLGREIVKFPPLSINRDQKCRGGIKGYSTSPGTIQRWVLTSHIVSKCMAEMQEEFGNTNLSVPKDLRKSRIAFNINNVEKALEVLTGWGSPFDYRDALINVTSGLEAPEEVSGDILQAHQKGMKAMNAFIDDRIKTSKVSFYAPIKQLALKTFKSMNKKKTIKFQDKTITLAAERSLFGRLLVIARNGCGLTLKQVLQYSLSPIPWALGLPDGSMVKTVKSKLLSKFNSFLEKCIRNVLNLLKYVNYAFIIETCGILFMFKIYNLKKIPLLENGIRN